MQITELGEEVIDVLISLEQYKKAYYELKKPVDEYFTQWVEKKYNLPYSDFFRHYDMKKPVNKSFSQWVEKTYMPFADFFRPVDHDQLDAIRNNILREIGFTDDDLEFYDSSGRGTALLLGALEGKILEVITIRCALISYRFTITDIARDVLNEILVNAATFRVSYLTENIRKDMSPGVRNSVELYRDGLLFDIRGNYYFPALIHKEIKNAILSYISLLKPSKRKVDLAYREIKSNLESEKLSSPEEAKKDEQRFICLLDAYEDYLSKLS
jgi:hypothetical protein